MPSIHHHYALNQNDRLLSFDEAVRYLRDNGEPERCPCCGGKVIPIVYGYPSWDMQDAAMRGEIVLGGCIVDLDDPEWTCVDCGASFRKCMFLELK